MTVLFLAGIGNSEDDHWQRHWQRRLPDSVWVEHTNWDHPECDVWVADLQAAVSAVPGAKLIVAHSLGCLLLAEWARVHADPTVVGTLLVAVPQPDGPAFPKTAHGFGHAPRISLPMRSVVVGSEDDPYGPLNHAEAMARAWGGSFVNVGRKGHINLQSGLSAWDEGWDLFRQHFPDDVIAAPRHEWRDHPAAKKGVAS